MSQQFTGEEDKSPIQLATFGAGCYWGTEKFFRKNFEQKFPKSIADVQVGFMGGRVSDPTYRQVCTGTTDHVEVAQVKFDSTKASYKDLVRFFFTFHDPTTANRQGNDVGTQYASVIFTHTPTQEDEAREVLNELQSMLDKKAITFVGAKFAGDKVATRIKSAQTFYAAEDDHQMYLFKNPGGYCNHGIRFVWDVKEVSGASQ